MLLPVVGGEPPSMDTAETRALRRAALLLLAVSGVRWGWSSGLRQAEIGGSNVLTELSGAAHEAATEAQRRRRPFGVDERIDPNRADEAELDRLAGVGPGTAAAIVTARDSGIVFRRDEDLLVVRGIGPALLGKIKPHLDLSSPPRGPAQRRRARPISPIRLDLNRAGVEELRSLPGVGLTLAERIVSARREELFHSIDDLIRVPGIGPATVERLRALTSVGRKP